MVRRALCIGCNYPSKKHGLHGAVNDAFLIADCLQRSCGFRPDDICVLHDMLPGGQAKSSERLVEPSKRSTRANIVQRLQWLTRSARPGDVLFLSFSGYGLQVDDVDGYHDDGLDEAILPTDFAEGVDGDFSVIVTSDIHDALMSVPEDCSVTVVMDCDHATSVIDVSGTLDGRLVKGVKLQTTCGLNAHGSKVRPGEHNRDLWLQEPGLSALTRPRFQPMMEIANPRKSRMPTRTAMSRSSPRAFCYSAAGHDQTALELQVTGLVDGRPAVQQHGALTWSFVHALEDLKSDCTHTQLLEAIGKRIAELKSRHLPTMDQQVLLTFAQPMSDPRVSRVLQAEPAAALGSSGRGGRALPEHSFKLKSSSASFPAVVPPPPPGFLGSGLSSQDCSFASLASSEDQQNHLASAGLQIWRAAWGGIREASTEDDEGVIDGLNPRDFQLPPETTPCKSTFGPLDGVPSATGGFLSGSPASATFTAAAIAESLAPAPTAPAPLPRPLSARCAPLRMAGGAAWKADDASTSSPLSSMVSIEGFTARSRSSDELSERSVATSSVPSGFEAFWASDLGVWAQRVFGQAPSLLMPSGDGKRQATCGRPL